MGLFLLLSTFIMLTILYVENNFEKRVAHNTMSEYFKLTNQSIEKDIEKLNDISNILLITNSSHLQNISYEDFYKDERKYFKIFTSQLDKTKKVYSMYIGFTKNRFYQIVKLDIDNKLHTKYNATKNDKWLLIEIDNNSNKKLSLFDISLNKTSYNEEKTNYEVLQRPWYKISVKSNKITKTGPYKFANIEARGLTYSKEIGNENIFGIDVLTNDFSKLITNKYENVSLSSLIVNEDLQVISSTKNESLDKIFLEKLEGKDLSKTLQDLTNIEGKEYLYNISKLNTHYDNEEYLISYVLFEEIVAPYMEQFKALDRIMVCLFLICIPIIWYFASVIVKPILSLEEESKKVENRQFNKVLRVNSFVSEINLLSTSVFNMAKSINIYQTDLEKIVDERTKELEEKNNELEILSITDKLTNIYNRMMIDKTLDERINSAKNDDSFGVIIIDIDYFKMVNDTQGHQTGDMTLILFAQILKENIRDTDLLGRWGGEEFVIICGNSSLDGTLILSEKLRKKVEEYDFPVIGKKTASFGVSAYIKGDTSKTIISRADDALYKAKEKGRNRVES